MLNSSRVIRIAANAISMALVFAASPGCLSQSSKTLGRRVAQSKPDIPADFDAVRAFEHVKRLVAFGPHPSGSEAIKKAQDYLEKELRSLGLKVNEDNFTAETPLGTVAMKNIIGELRGQKRDVVLITGHYDTKLQSGFVGANDGGSSAAAVLETARVLSKTLPEYTLWFVLFDGEEAVVDWSAMDGKDNTYGSRHLAAKLQADGALSTIKAMVLYDMIGDKDLDIKREGESTQWLVDAVWKAAHALGYQKRFLNSEQYISDDHLPFKEAGVAVIDLIDFNYGPAHSYWHTNLDTLDKISGESIKAAGDAVIRALPEIFKHLDRPAAAATKRVPN